MKKFFTFFATLFVALAVNAASAKTIYLKPGVWAADGAKFAVWDITHSAWSEFMTLAENETDIYTTTIPADATKVIFVRLNGTLVAPEWGDNKSWNQTADQDIPEGKDFYTVTGWETGSWSKYEPTPEPASCDWDNIAWVSGSNDKLKVCKEGEVPGVVNVQKPGWATESGIYVTFPSAAWDKSKFSLPEDKYAIEGAGMVIYLSALDLKYNEISINCNKTDYAFTVFNVDGAEELYAVAGSSATLFGNAWDTYANFMTENESVYKWEKTGVELAVGDINFKVVKNHSWDTSWPADNKTLNIAESGIYTITITFNPANKEISAVANKTGEAVVLPEIKLHGNFTGGSWADTEKFVAAENKQTASLELSLGKGTYEFGVKKDGTFTANGVAFTRENPSAAVVAGEGNLTINADVAGDYTFTWTFETNTLSIEYPELPIVYCEYATGHLSNPECDANGRILLTIRKIQKSNNLLVVVKNNSAAGNTKDGLNYLWVNATGATNNNATFGSHSAANAEEASVVVEFDAEKESYVFNNIHWSYSGWDGEWAIDDLTVKASELCDALVLENGYYLIGLNGWDAADLTADDLFVANEGAEGEEYKLTTALQAGDKFKAVYVKNDAIKYWYPDGIDNEYLVDADHAGAAKTIYFRPFNDKAEWGCHFYVAPNDPSALDNTAVEGKATKSIVNGMLLIIRDGKTYNVLGTMVK